MDWYQTIVADILAFQSTESTPTFVASDLGTQTLLQDIDDILLSPKDFEFQKVLDLNPHNVDWPSIQLDAYHVYFDRETRIATRAATPERPSTARSGTLRLDLCRHGIRA